MSDQAMKSDRQTNIPNRGRHSEDDTKTVKKSTTLLPAGGAQYTFSGEVTDEFSKTIDTFVERAAMRLQSQMGQIANEGANEALPFRSERQGSVLHLYWPVGTNQGNMLAELIGVLAAKLPNVVVHSTSDAWSEPTWTREQNLRLMGLVVGIQGPPESFAHTSNPVDLMSSALWILACNTALSRPGGVSDAIASVVPQEIGGAKSASKYMTKALMSLRSNITDKKMEEAIPTLERLLKLWTRSVEKDALDLVRRHKIAWGTVLNSAAPTIKKRVKGKDITNIDQPLKPTRSPWITGKERTALNKMYDKLWKKPDEYRENWNKLSSQQQHSQYDKYHGLVKSHYDSLKVLATSIHSKLGHRKTWINSACKAKGVEPKTKKDKAIPHAWTESFFKNVNTREIKLSGALVFCPAHWLPEESHGTESLAMLWALKTRITPAEVAETLDEDNEDYALWVEWAERFAPDLSINKDKLPSSQPLDKDDNPFSVLEEESLDSLTKNQ